ncbi:MAG: hypothetical protein ACPGVA_17460 [Pikeienuella sp.]
MTILSKLKYWLALFGDLKIQGHEIRNLKGFFVGVAIVASHFTFNIVLDDGKFTISQADVLNALRNAGHAELSRNQDYLLMLEQTRRRAEKVVARLRADANANYVAPKNSENWRKLAEDLEQSSPLLIIESGGRYITSPSDSKAGLVEALVGIKTQDEAVNWLRLNPVYRRAIQKRPITKEMRTNYIWCKHLNAAKQTCQIELEADTMRFVQAKVTRTTRFFKFSGARIYRGSDAPVWRARDQSSLVFPIISREAFVDWQVKLPVIDTRIHGTADTPIVDVSSRTERPDALVLGDCVDRIMKTTRAFRNDDAAALIAARSLCTIQPENISDVTTFVCGNETIDGNIALCPAVENDQRVKSNWSTQHKAGLLKRVEGPFPQSFTFDREIDRLAIALFENAISTAEKSDRNFAPAVAFAQSARAMTRKIVKDYATIFGTKDLPPDLLTIIGGDKIKDHSRIAVLVALTRQPQLIAYYKHRNILAPFIYHNLLQQLEKMGLVVFVDTTGRLQ